MSERFEAFPVEDNPFKKQEASVVESEKLKKTIRDVNTLLETKQPEKFSPFWLQKNDHELYIQIKKCMKASNKPNQWSWFIDQLDPIWRDKWRIQRQEKKDTSLEGVLQETRVLLEAKQPEAFSPIWLHGNAQGLYDRVRNQMKVSGNQGNWDWFIGQLDPVWQERWGFKKLGREKKTLEEIVMEMQAFLEAKQPETFSPVWIQRNYPGLFVRVREQMKLSGNQRNWDWLIGQLDPVWQERWAFNKRESITLDEVTQEANAFLEAKQPVVFSPGWLYKNDSGLYERIRKQLKLSGSQGNWDWFIGQLDPVWQERWEIQKTRGEKSLEACIVAVQTVLEAKRPDKFSPKWFQKNGQGLYDRIRKQMSTSGNAGNWEWFVDQLDPVWQERWKFQKQESATLEETVQETNSLLAAKRPESFSPFWLQKNGGKLYTRIRKQMKVSGNQGKWEWFVDQLDPVWQEKWHRLKRLTEFIPKETYENTEEVNAALESFRDNKQIYLMLGGETDQEALIQQKMYSVLIDLAQKGNVSAYIELNMYLNYVIQDWIDKDSYFRSIATAEGKIDEVIKASVYRYQSTDGNFLQFLKKRLRSEVYGTSKKQIFIDQPVRKSEDSDYTWHQRLGTEDESFEAFHESDESRAATT